MRKKGRENPEYAHGEGGEVVDNRKWYERVDPSLEIPYIGRPRGKGTRLDFYAESQFSDMALEIKEASKRRFKNTNDVHRAAHYIGMYILRTRIVGDGPVDFISKIHQKMEPLYQAAQHKAELQKELKHHFEQFCLGRLHHDQLLHGVKIMLNDITDPSIRQWVEDEFEDMMSRNSDEYLRVKNKLSVRKSRDKKKELGLRLISGEEE
jgi:hypothetical protein